MTDKHPDKPDHEKSLDGSEYPYDAYLNHRRSLIDLASEQARSFDKQILALSAGALGLSIVFLKNFSPFHPLQLICVLILSWFCFVLSITMTVVSLLVGSNACQQEVKRFDEWYDRGSSEELTSGSNPSHALITGLNYASGGFFVLGVVLLFVFVVANIG